MTIPSIPPSAPFIPTKYAKEYWVDPVSGNDSNTGNTPTKAWKTLSKAFSTLNNSGNCLNLAAGIYTGSALTCTIQNLTICGMSSSSGIVDVMQDINFAHTASSVYVENVSFNNLTLSNAGKLYVDGIFVKTSLVKSGSGYLQVSNSDTQGPSSSGTVSITGSGYTYFINASLVGFATINNASATVAYITTMNGYHVTLTAGTLILSNTRVWSQTDTSNAVSAAAGTTFQAINSQFITPTLGEARISALGNCSLQNCQIDKTNSTFGTNLQIQTVSNDISAISSLEIPSSTLASLPTVGNRIYRDTSLLNQGVVEMSVGGGNGAIPMSPLAITGVLTETPTGSTSSGLYVQTVGTPPSGIALGDIFYWTNPSAAKLLYKYANVNFFSVGTTSYQKNAVGYWAQIPKSGATNLVSVFLAGNLSATAGAYDPIICNSVEYNPGNWYDTTTGRFTPQLAGLWSVLQTAAPSGHLSGHAGVSLARDGTGEIIAEGISFNPWSCYAQKTLYFNGTTDYIESLFYSSTDSSQIPQEPFGTFFQAVYIGV